MIYGNDYPTIDWTWVRDYIHVVDLVNWHLKSYNYLLNNYKNWFSEVFNIWTWNWVSVLQILNFAKDIIWKDINYEIIGRRPWDLPEFYCDPKKANKILWWKSELTIKQAIEDSWRFVNNK
jgi:UDP-glucose 4-epimerase